MSWRKKIKKAAKKVWKSDDLLTSSVKNSDDLTLKDEASPVQSVATPPLDIINCDYDVSVVIPVYNCEEFLDQCIRSVAENQDCRVEIIAINDESPDDALSILRKLETEFSNLIVIDQKNRGGAPTLNRGLDMARGEFVTFLDSDDWMAPHALDLLLFRARSDKSQVSVGAIEKYINGEHKENYDLKFVKTSFIWDVEKEGVVAKYLHDGFYTGKIFLRRFLQENEIRFHPDLLYADRPFITKALLNARRVSYSSSTAAFWRKREGGGSITDSMDTPKALIDKALAYAETIIDPSPMSNDIAKKEIAEQAFHRLFWSYENALKYGNSTSYATALLILARAYPEYQKLSRLSLKNKRLVEQATKYDPTDFSSFARAIEDAVTTTRGKPDSVVAAAIRAVNFRGSALKTEYLIPVLKDTEAFLFESNFGKQYGGNPRYIYEELLQARENFTAIWVYSSTRKPFKNLPTPKNGQLIQVSRGSPEYHHWMRRARYWINNIRFPEGDKPDGTIYIQTWHGTPLKRLGLDIEVSGPEVEVRESFLKEVDNWDYLLAQNDYAKDVFERAFDTKCPVLVEGYPANDVLVDEKRREKVASYVRKRYGIPKGKKIITYAPTWRDNDRVGNQWVFANRIRLDFYRLRESLGEDYVLVVRLHHLMARNPKTKGLEGFLFDASGEPDANRLLCATDVLITDYSSIFFDYACTGRPILFYMFDRTEYENDIRGLYLDPDTDLPGPVLTTEMELIDAIKNIDDVQANYSDTYERFQERFNSHDDGNASRNVIDHVFSEETSATLLRERSAKKKAELNGESFDYDISVIIQVYNCEEFLEQCIRSVAEDQDCRVEIIAINDESPDDALSVLRELETKFSNLIVIDQKNRGGAQTLNRGLDMARGEFVTFLDSDDWMAPNSLDLLLFRARNDRSQVSVGSIENYIDGEYIESDDLKFINASFVWDIEEEGINAKYLHDGSYAGKIFLRRFLQENQIKFHPDLLYADRPFVTKAFLNANRVSYSSSTAAFSRKYEDGVSNTDSTDTSKSLIDQALGCAEMIINCSPMNNPVAKKEIAEQGFHRLFLNLKQVLKSDEPASFATALLILATAYPDYKKLSRLSLKNNRLTEQAAKYDPSDFSSFAQEMDNAIAATRGMPVAEIAKAIRSVKFRGAVLKADHPIPLLKDTNAFLFESNFGKQYGGNPRYIYEELLQARENFTAIWVYSSTRKPFKNLPTPKNGQLIQVSRGSPEYHHWMRRARYWINNIRFPEGDKPDGTIYIQTWHGTPLKRLGLDIEVSGPEVEVRESFLKEVDNWDYLLAQNDYAKDVFERAFDTKCPVLVEGYPANDVLVDEKRREKVASYVRKRYGIPKGKKIITYAPTWRDNDRVGNQWVFANRIRLDFYRLRESLGEDYVLVVRLHHLMARNPKTKGLEGFLFDASGEPDANRLLCATDVLITDYSSIFFDYACTSRPILFYMFDRTEYENDIRGLYLDPDTDLPGPVLTTEMELIDAIKNIDDVQANYSDTYERFQERFNSHDDGNASRNVIDHVFSEEASATLLRERSAKKKAELNGESFKNEFLHTDWDRSEHLFELSVILVNDGKENSVTSAIDAHSSLWQFNVQIIVLKTGRWNPPAQWKELLKDGRLKLVDSARSPLEEKHLNKAVAAADGHYLTVQDPYTVLIADTLLKLVKHGRKEKATMCAACQQASDGRFPISIARLKERAIFNRSNLNRLDIALNVGLGSAIFLRAQLAVKGFAGERTFNLSQFRQALPALLMDTPRAFTAPLTISQTTQNGNRSRKRSKFDSSLELLSLMDASMEQTASIMFVSAMKQILSDSKKCSRSDTLGKIRLLASVYPQGTQFPVVSGKLADLLCAIMPNVAELPSSLQFTTKFKTAERQVGKRKKACGPLARSREQCVLRLTSKTDPVCEPFPIESAADANTILFLQNDESESRAHLYQLIYQAITHLGNPNIVIVCPENLIQKLQNFFKQTSLSQAQATRLRFVELGSSDHYSWIARAGSILVNGIVDGHVYSQLEQIKQQDGRAIIQTSNSWIDDAAYIAGEEVCEETLMSQSKLWTYATSDHTSEKYIKKMVSWGTQGVSIAKSDNHTVDLTHEFSKISHEVRTNVNLHEEDKTLGLFLRCDKNNVPQFDCDTETVREGLPEWKVLMHHITWPKITSPKKLNPRKDLGKSLPASPIQRADTHLNLLPCCDVVASDDPWVLMQATDMGKACIVLSNTTVKESAKSCESEVCFAHNDTEIATVAVAAKQSEELLLLFKINSETHETLPHWTEVLNRKFSG